MQAFTTRRWPKSSFRIACGSPSYAFPCRRFASTTSSTNQHDQTITLPDGRRVGFAEYGPRTGYPLFYLHGFPSSRFEARGFDDIGQRNHIRVIGPDRPGFGLSSSQPNRRITDYPSDILYLAQHLGLKRFAVLGGSGGGPYALACANSIPSKTLSAVGMMASAPPWESGTQDLLLTSRLISWAATYWPAGLRGLSNILINMAKRGLATNAGKKMIDGLVEKAAANARKGSSGTIEQATMEERRNRFLRLAFEGFAQGSGAAVQEAYLLSHPWGIQLEQVPFNKVRIWHNIEDKNSPIRMVRYMAERIPHCSLVEYEGNHFAITSLQLEEIVRDLIPAAEIESYRQEKET